MPGRHDVSLVVEDERRDLLVYVPESVAGSVAAPVVFVVHGTSQTGEYFFNNSGWNALADTEGFIVVYPDALSYCYHQDDNGDGDTDDPGEQSVTTKWSSGFFTNHPLCTAEEIAALPARDRALADHPLRDDVAFFGAMIDRLATDAVIDTRRVYATGFSNGAQMTSRLGNDLPDRFAAVASHAGFLEGVEPRVPTRPIAFALSAGAADPHWATPTDPIPLDETIFEEPFFVRTIAEYLTMTQLSDAHEHTTVTLGTRTVSRFSWTTSTVGADNRLELAIISDLMHMYPSFEPQLWDFFSAHSLP